MLGHADKALQFHSLNWSMVSLQTSINGAHLGPSFSLPLTHVVSDNNRALEFCICTYACDMQILLDFAIYFPVYTHVNLMLF